MKTQETKTAKKASKKTNKPAAKVARSHRTAMPSHGTRPKYSRNHLRMRDEERRFSTSFRAPTFGIGTNRSHPAFAQGGEFRFNSPAAVIDRVAQYTLRSLSLYFPQYLTLARRSCRSAVCCPIGLR